MGDEDFVSILVPKDRVMDIYQLIAGKPAAPTDTANSMVARQEPPSSGNPTTDSAIVARAYRESSPKMRQFFELLAARPDEWVAIDDIRESLSLEVRQLPGQLGAFQRRWQGRLKQSGKWPFDAEWSDVTGTWRWAYRMPQVNADLIKSLS
jgi:hypothetical protein